MTQTEQKKTDARTDSQAGKHHIIPRKVYLQKNTRERLDTNQKNTSVAHLQTAGHDERSDGPAALLVKGGGEGGAADQPHEELDGRRPRAVLRYVAGRVRGFRALSNVFWCWGRFRVGIKSLNENKLRNERYGLNDFEFELLGEQLNHKSQTDEIFCGSQPKKRE